MFLDQEQIRLSARTSAVCWNARACFLLADAPLHVQAKHEPGSYCHSKCRCVSIAYKATALFSHQDWRAWAEHFRVDFLFQTVGKMGRGGSSRGSVVKLCDGNFSVNLAHLGSVVSFLYFGQDRCLSMRTHWNDKRTFLPWETPKKEKDNDGFVLLSPMSSLFARQIQCRTFNPRAVSSLPLSVDHPGRLFCFGKRPE